MVADRQQASDQLTEIAPDSSFGRKFALNIKGKEEEDCMYR